MTNQKCRFQYKYQPRLSPMYQWQIRNADFSINTNWDFHPCINDKEEVKLDNSGSSWWVLLITRFQSMVNRSTLTGTTVSLCKRTGLQGFNPQWKKNWHWHLRVSSRRVMRSTEKERNQHLCVIKKSYTVSIHGEQKHFDWNYSVTV